MKYENITQQIEIIVTKQCNWNCKHCLYNSSYEIQLTEEKILRHLPYISKYLDVIKNISICLLGGEIGLVDKSCLELIFNILNKSVLISTNGVFVDRHYNAYFDNYIKCILLHLSDEPNKRYLNLKKASYGKVFNNIHQVVPFLKKSTEFAIDYLSFDYNLYDIPPTVEQIYNNYSYLLNTCVDYNNITENCINDIKRKISLLPNLIVNRRYCSMLNETISIDLESEKILQCTGRSLNSIELTDDNFRKILLPHKELFSDNKFCKSCVPWCIEKDRANIVKTKFNNYRCLNAK